MGCHPECYTKGRGCMVSGDGTCLVLFAKQGEPGYNLRNYKAELEKFLTSQKSIKLASEKAKRK